MDLGDIEGTADELLRRAGFDVDDEPCPLALTTALLGPGSVRLVHSEAAPGGAVLARVGDVWRVYLRRLLPVERKRFLLLHELAHWALGVTANEEDCDTLAAALLLPRRAFLRQLRLDGARITRLARHFGTSESCVALRLGETTGAPLVLITPRSVRVRGDDFGWPSESRIRELVRERTPGIRKATLRDDPRRTLIRAV